MIMTYIVALAVFLGIDLLWLGVVAKNFYRNQLEKLLLEDFNMVAAFIFYALFVVGLQYFVIQPHVQNGDLKETLTRAAAYGFFTYMTYDLTNLSTLNGWPVKLVFVDIAWGVVLALSVTFITIKIRGL